jgi:hypothetical protein
MAISVKQFRTERKKTLVWQTIILKNDPLLLVLKEPIDSLSNGNATSEISFPKQNLDLTWPIDGRCNLTGQGTAHMVIRMVDSGAVRRYIEARGLRTANDIKNPSCRLRSIKYQEENCCTCHVIHKRRYSSDFHLRTIR